MHTVAVAVMGYRAGLALMIETARVVRGHVDEFVVQADDFTEDDWKAMEDAYPGLVRVVYPWKEDFSDYRNHMVNACTAEWVLSLDHDEIPTPELAEGLRGVVEEAARKRANMVGFYAITEIRSPDGTKRSWEGSGKDGMLITRMPDAYRGDVHVWMGNKRWTPHQSTLRYKHVKTDDELVERAVRNIFMGGGGDTWKDTHERSSPLWRPMRDWCANNLGITEYKGFLAYLRGPVDPWMTDWIQKAAAQPWHDDEYRAILKYYNKHHPAGPL